MVQVLERTGLDLNAILSNFIDESFEELEEEGSMCLEVCEEEDNYHMTSYWLDGTYTETKNFLMKHYHKEYFNELCNIIISRYPNDLSKLKTKMGDRSQYKGTLAYECLASILLKRYQSSPIWYTVYGSDEEDMIDFDKYNIINALNDKDEFPVMKMSDVTAAMLGVNYTAQPSDMYDVFAYYADELRNEEVTLLNEEKKAFTPDAFMYEAIQARWKNYIDMSRNQKVYYLEFLEKVLKAQNEIKVFSKIKLVDYDLEMAIQMKNIILEDYYTRFSAPPNSLPLHRDILSMDVIKLDNKNVIQAKFKIRGVQDKESVWKDIMLRYYDIPQNAEETMQTVFKLAIDMKVELAGLEAQKATKLRKAIPAIEGQYPRKNLATHGLKFIDDMNVHYKDSRGRDCKKRATARFSLAMAEKQSTYLLKKILRYSKNTTISCSFGIDSEIALHLLRKVTKKGFKTIFNNSRVEYPETYEIKRQLEKEWDLDIIETLPLKTYWEMLKLNGFNFDRKGDRREKVNGSKKSNSEQCCLFIKHKPFFDIISKNNFDINISGLRADESRARLQAGLRDGAVYYAKTWNMIRVNPIIFFTEDLKWQYIKKYAIKYSKIYDMKLYYEDVFENVSEEDFGKVCYEPRTGCWPCMVRMDGLYLYWLKKYKNKMYWYLMKDKGLARTLFNMNAYKVGLAKKKIENVEKTTETQNVQLSFFESEQNSSCACNACKNSFDDYSDDDILDKITVEVMEKLITSRPCTFMVS